MVFLALLEIEAQLVLQGLFGDQKHVLAVLGLKWVVVLPRLDLRGGPLDELELVQLDVVIGLLQVFEVIQLRLLHRLVNQVAHFSGQTGFGPGLRSVLHGLHEGQVELGRLAAIFEERVLLVGGRREHQGGATPSISLGRHGGL